VSPKQHWQGVSGIFFPDTDAKTSRRCPDPPTHPQFTLKRHDFGILAPKIKISAPKFKYLVPKSQNVALNSNMTDKIQIK